MTRYSAAEVAALQAELQVARDRATSAERRLRLVVGVLVQQRDGAGAMAPAVADMLVAIVGDVFGLDRPSLADLAPAPEAEP